MVSAIASRQGERKLDMVAVMLAGACTFLTVYTTQPLLPLLRRVFHASELEVSLTISATALAIAIAAPIAGLLAERLGRRRVIVPSVFALPCLCCSPQPRPTCTL